jgi:hypothetical protein
MAKTARPAIPDEGTPEYDLWIAAIEIATSAPLRQGTNVTSAGIYWPRIHALRAALDALGIDWRAAKAAENGSPR